MPSKRVRPSRAKQAAPPPTPGLGATCGQSALKTDSRPIEVAGDLSIGSPKHEVETHLVSQIANMIGHAKKIDIENLTINVTSSKA